MDKRLKDKVFNYKKINIILAVIIAVCIIPVIVGAAIEIEVWKRTAIIGIFIFVIGFLALGLIMSALKERQKSTMSIVVLCFVLIALLIIHCFVITHLYYIQHDKKEAFDSGDWVAIILGTFGTSATTLLGYIAVWQNRKADENAEKANNLASQSQSLALAANELTKESQSLALVAQQNENKIRKIENMPFIIFAKQCTVEVNPANIPKISDENEKSKLSWSFYNKSDTTTNNHDKILINLKVKNVTNVLIKHVKWNPFKICGRGKEEKCSDRCEMRYILPQEELELVLDINISNAYQMIKISEHNNKKHCFIQLVGDIVMENIYSEKTVITFNVFITWETEKENIDNNAIYDKSFIANCTMAQGDIEELEDKK